MWCMVIGMMNEKSNVSKGSLPRLVRRDTVVSNKGSMILLVPIRVDRWDKYVWSGEWLWDDQIGDDSARSCLQSPHYIAPNAKLRDAGESGGE